MRDYKHDYGTICHALAACALAAAHAADNDEQGGITGFQSSFVMFDFVKEWLHLRDPSCLRLVNYDDMLYPQNEHRFQNTIDSDTMKVLQKKAVILLAENYDKETTEIHVAESVANHWMSIVGGKVPFGYKIRDNEGEE